MILQNMKRALSGVWFRVENTNIACVDVNGEEQPLSNYSYPNNFLNNLKETKNYDVPDGVGIVLGTGIGEVTKGDYCLFELWSDYDIISQSYIPAYSASYRNTDDIMYFSKTIKNTSNLPVTITEVGLVCRYNSAARILLIHDVLDTPLTLEPDETGTVTVRVAIS